MNYDEFQEGDRIWSEMFGFDTIAFIEDENGKVHIEGLYGWITLHGRKFNYPQRPRTFFHAVADTDEGMREAIARGEGLKRPVPRGRWPIEPEDRVIAFGCDLKFSIGVANVTKESSEGESYPININSFTFTKGGLFSHYNPIPRAMRLYDGEEPFEDPCENMRWMMDEAIKFGWHEKYGKGKNHDTE